MRAPLAEAQATTAWTTPDGLIRWRVTADGTLERSTSTQKAWEPVAIDRAISVTGGAAPTPSTCWLVGRDGAVLLSTDGRRFSPVRLGDSIDLVSVRASDARTATVTAVDRRQFATSDGGWTWRVIAPQ